MSSRIGSHTSRPIGVPLATAPGGARRVGAGHSGGRRGCRLRRPATAAGSGWLNGAVSPWGGNRCRCGRQATRGGDPLATRGIGPPAERGGERQLAPVSPRHAACAASASPARAIESAAGEAARSSYAHMRIYVDDPGTGLAGGTARPSFSASRRASGRRSAPRDRQTAIEAAPIRRTALRDRAAPPARCHAPGGSPDAHRHPPGGRTARAPGERAFGAPGCRAVPARSHREDGMEADFVTKGDNSGDPNRVHW